MPRLSGKYGINGQTSKQPFVSSPNGSPKGGLPTSSKNTRLNTLVRIVLLGPPGSGKGTQAETLVKDYHLAHISTGNILRENIRKGTMLGKQAKAIIGSGQLVNDEIMIGIIKDAVKGKKNFILDGFPRTIKQAEDLEKINLSPNLSLYINCPDDAIIKRLSGRRTNPITQQTYNIYTNPPPKGMHVVQREDDRENVVKDRLAVYRKSTAPLIDFYKKKGILREVNGEQTIENVAKNVNAIMQKIA
ncbi:adenylate kinase [Candidatus Woesearchaeota archaeon]|nr:adenylate kinase [Candidatus Woesearchaeota archaeon]HIH38599.1 adenylate kinase [Candidatus Woesearchaeota archaeon]HIH48606.1 adenylate kinase [Candidatus Woesearchaeota archaeon]HIJ02803.1 adenylate kinase [Candidatus Woesearchaeota archaeon]